MNVLTEYGSALGLLFLLCVGMYPRRETPETHLLSAQESSAEKGLLCILIFYNHFSGYFLSLGPVFYVFNHIGHMLVADFFFLSAYGLEKAYAGKKLGFDFLLKRFGKVLIPYWICLAVSVFANWQFAVPNKEAVTARNILLSVIPLREVVENSWYVAAILFLYALFFLCTLALPKVNKALKMSVVMLLVSVFLYAQWAPTFFAFPLGCLVAQYETELLAFLRRRKVSAALLLFAAAAGSALLKIYGQHIGNSFVQYLSDSLTVLLFPLLAYTAALLFRFGNPALFFLGKISYEIYLIHGLSIHIAVMTPGTDGNAALLCVCALGYTLALAWAIHFLGGKIIRLCPWNRRKA